MKMVSVRLPEELESRLDHLADITKRPKSFYVKEALECYLEDMEDAYAALERIAKPNRTYYTTEELLKQLSSDTK
jgi:RHH-type rel operon transcriptional repressor/antitoxin RelB